MVSKKPKKSQKREITTQKYAGYILPSDLSCDKRLSPPWALVVEQNPVASVHPVSLSVVHH